MDCVAGLFRVSGNAKLVDRLRNTFDQFGDAPLETDGDVPSAAALLKLFLRELPEPVIPLHVHSMFIEIAKGELREIGKLMRDVAHPALRDVFVCLA